MVSGSACRECVVPIRSDTSQYGMQTFVQSIYGLFVNGDITYEMVTHRASNPNVLMLRIKGVTSTTGAVRDELTGAPSSIRLDDYQPVVKPHVAPRAGLGPAGRRAEGANRRFVTEEQRRQAGRPAAEFLCVSLLQDPTCAFRARRRAEPL